MKKITTSFYYKEIPYNRMCTVEENFNQNFHADERTFT